MLPVATTNSMSPVPRMGLRGSVVDRLITAIFQGEIRPGERMIVQKLAQRLNVSATPVREALVELESIGLIEMQPNRGAVCKQFDARQLREIYQIRRILEEEATREACPRIPVERLRNLETALNKLLADEKESAAWSQTAMQLDSELHSLILEHCGSFRLQHEIRRYGDLMQTIRQVVGNRDNLQRIAAAEHAAIVRALLAGKADDAAHAMADHINSTARGVEQLMFTR